MGSFENAVQTTKTLKWDVWLQPNIQMPGMFYPLCSSGKLWNSQFQLNYWCLWAWLMWCQFWKFHFENYAATHFNLLKKNKLPLECARSAQFSQIIWECHTEMIFIKPVKIYFADLYSSYCIFFLYNDDACTHGEIHLGVGLPLLTFWLTPKRD